MRRLKFLALFLVLLLVTTISVGCMDKIFGPIEDEGTPIEQEPDNDEENQEQVQDGWELDFYCIDKTTDMLIPVTITYPKQEGIAKAVAQELVLGSNLSREIAGYGLEMPLPQYTEVLGISINEKVAKVDLSPEFMNFKDKNHEDISVAALVYTLTQFSTIDSVEIVINGQKLQKLTYDTYINLPMDREIGLNVTVNDGVDLKDSSKVLVYYPQKRNAQTIYIPESKVVRKTEDLLKVAVTEFLKGPNKSTISSLVPSNVDVIQATVENNVAIINLTENFIEYSSNNEKGIINSLVLTVTEIEGVDQVQLLVDSSPVVLPEGTDLGNLFTRPVFVKFK
ncbi:GerMN domain-containing protein [Alkalicella caledoniensis]|uniref:GerMN domain-containing protein n=1 Tax=Alkalicella caledoniensis TaxID=2731377 RepID=A0A7G9W4R8_ALKCA|nr:GerMN domain-containing protein [Alkalicella caledoniensis]QNO13680.1 GerMN domain-containing protein [Alkalicella caledoniensis]